MPGPHLTERTAAHAAASSSDLLSARQFHGTPNNRSWSLPFCNAASKPPEDEAISTAHPLHHKYCNFCGLCNDRAGPRQQRRRSGWFQTRGEGLPDLTSPVRRVPDHCHPPHLLFLRSPLPTRLTAPGARAEFQEVLHIC